MKFRDFAKENDYVGAGIIFVTSKKEILILQKENGRWTFPGGHREPGEKPIETAYRECKEELGGFPNNKIIGKIKNIKEEVKKPVYSFFMLVDEPFTPTLSWEHKGFKWINYKDINPEDLTKVFRPYWELYKYFIKAI